MVIKFISLSSWAEGFAGSTVVKNLPANAGDTGSVPELGKSPGVGNGYPLQYSCLMNPCGQRSLAGYSPWSLKVLDMTERLKNNNSSVLGCISSLYLALRHRHATMYLGFPPGNQHSHSLQHVDDVTHCFPLNIFTPVFPSQRSEPQWPHGSSQRWRGHPWHLNFNLSLWPPNPEEFISLIFSNVHIFSHHRHRCQLCSNINVLFRLW